MKLARRGFASLNGEQVHELNRLLQAEGCDALWVEGMKADLGAHGWCPKCQRANSPAMYRLYVQVRRAVGSDGLLMAELVEAIESARGHRETLDEAQGMDDAAVEARAIRWLASRHAVPESVMRSAVLGARDGNLAGLAHTRREVEAQDAPRERKRP